MLIGYARVSTKEQNLDRQIDALIDAGVDKRNIYKEKMTGTKTDRPRLIKVYIKSQFAMIIYPIQIKGTLRVPLIYSIIQHYSLTEPNVKSLIIKFDYI